MTRLQDRQKLLAILETMLRKKLQFYLKQGAFGPSFEQLSLPFVIRDARRSKRGKDSDFFAILQSCTVRSQTATSLAFEVGIPSCRQAIFTTTAC